MRPADVRRANCITIAASVSLLVIGCLGAWFINHLHRLNSTMLARHASYVIAAEELEIEAIDRSRLQGDRSGQVKAHPLTGTLQGVAGAWRRSIRLTAREGVGLRGEGKAGGAGL